MALRNKVINKPRQKPIGFYDLRSSCPKISVAFEPQMFAELRSMAEQRNWPLAALIRHLVEQQIAQMYPSR